MHLRANSLSDTDILTSSVPISSTSRSGFYRFSLPPISHSHSNYYYAFLEQRGPGQTHVSTGDLAAYLDGTLYCDHQPQESQAVFRLSYTPGLILLDLLLMVMGWIGYGTAAVVVLFLAGYGIVRHWARQTQADFTAVLILSMASALSAWMVALVWFSVFHVYLSAWGVRSLIGIATLGGLCLFVRDKDMWQKRTYWLGKSFRWTLALWVVVFLSIGLRLFIGRDMVMLPGSDTYHHTLIAQLFAEQGGIPSSYEPYAPLISFSYHFGFHSIVALFRWLFGTELLLTTKTVALVLNGAIAATVGLLAERLAGHRRAGVIAAVLVGLIMVSPFCLLRWGRFTQTVGLLFLSLGLWALIVSVDQSGWLLPSLLMSSVFLSHYRVFFLMSLFILLLGIIKILQRHWKELRYWLVIGIIVVVLVAPWLIHVVWVAYGSQGLKMVYPTLPGYNTPKRLEEPILHFTTNWLAAGGLLTTLSLYFGKKNKVMAWAFLGWCLILVMGALYTPLLTGSYFWDLKTTLLSLSVPFAILVGWGMEELWCVLQQWRYHLLLSGLALFLLTGVYFGTYNFPKLLRTGNIYLRSGSLVAIDWVKENTSENALFIANGVQPEWSPGWIIGTNAGYWFPLLARRDTTPPLMIYPLERVSATDVFSGLPASEKILSLANDGKMENASQVLRHEAVTHIFTEAGQWPLMPHALVQDPNLRVVYRQDRVWIFEVLP